MREIPRDGGCRGRYLKPPVPVTIRQNPQTSVKRGALSDQSHDLRPSSLKRDEPTHASQSLAQPDKSRGHTLATAQVGCEPTRRKGPKTHFNPTTCEDTTLGTTWTAESACIGRPQKLPAHAIAW